VADNLKILGQSNPSATTNTNLYTVPDKTQTTISSITVAETSGADATFRIAVRVGGATLSGLSQYIAYNKTVPANDTISFVIGITLNQTDIVTVYASSANVAFNVFGCETLEER